MMDGVREKIADIIYPEGVERRNKLERIANTDKLTGVGNRRAFELAQKSAELAGHWFVIIDGDNFGEVNKVAGHEVGDKAILALVDQIRFKAKIFGGDNRIFRFGGDEFVMIVEDFHTEKWGVVPNKFISGQELGQSVIDFVELIMGMFQFGGVMVGATGGIGKTLEYADAEMRRKKLEKKQPK